MTPLGWAIAIAALLAVAAGSAGAHYAATRPGAELVIVGDSLAVGMGPRLCRLRDLACRVMAEEGATMIEWYGRAVTEFVGFDGRTVVFVLGTNDSVASDAYQAELPRLAWGLVQAARSRGAARVVWVLPPKLPWPTDRVDAAIRGSGAEWLRPPEFERAADGIHYTPSGYGEFARWLDARV